MDVIPPITTADELVSAINAAADNEGARWYFTKKADSLRRLDALPTEWDLPTVVAANREFSKEVRDRYASEGVAMKDGSFPIPDRDALRRAIASVGRASNYDAARRHIIKRARALDAVGMLPEDWGITASVLAEEDALKIERLNLERELLASA